MLHNGVSHGDWCNARTCPSKCKACKAAVFYFSCDCGSKVFFDQLGGRWPEHICVQVKVMPEKAVLGSVAQLMQHHESRIEDREPEAEDAVSKVLRLDRESWARLDTYQLELATGKGAWLGTQQGLCHHSTKSTDTHFACGISITTQFVVDVQERTRCLDCIEALKLPISQRPKPQVSTTKTTNKPPKKQGIGRSAEYAPPKGHVRLFG